MGYAELHCLSNFSFLRGASHPEELVERAVALGYAALALTDECSVAGLVRAHVAARGTSLALIAGTELRLEDGLRCVLLAADRPGYARLCRLITQGRRAAPKGRYRLSRIDLLVLTSPSAHSTRQAAALREVTTVGAVLAHPDRVRGANELSPRRWRVGTITVAVSRREGRSAVEVG